jgi:hypothetical protein
VNVEQLSRFARWAEKIAAALTDLSREMSAELTRAEAAQDPLGVHISRARASYRTSEDGDNSKTGKRVALNVRTTFNEAQELGFRGSYKDWDSLMKSGKIGAK